MPLSDFELLHKLGSGSYSTVYKVRRKSDNTFYALKKVNYHKMTQQERKNALTEVRILASVNHPNVIGYKEAFTDQATNALCVVMEHAPGGDFFAKVQQHRKQGTHFSEAEIWTYFKQALMGLSALHSLGILHRDIKSANLFIGQHNQLKLGDLNVAKVAGVAHTQTGTPYYASPEIWKNAPYNSKCDVWSLGCTLYELMSLDVPFKAQGMGGVYRKILSGKYKPLPRIYSNDLKSVIDLMLQVSPRRRPSCLELLNLPSVLRNVDVPSELLGSADDLMGTIHLPPSIRHMKKVLPAPRYSRRSLSTEKLDEDKENVMPILTPKPGLKVQRPAKAADNIFKNRLPKLP